MTPEKPQIYIQPADPSIPASAWVVIGAAVQGSSHIATAQPCQDAFAYQVIKEDIIAVVVADGLGSAANAQRGAKLAVASAMTYLEQQLAQAAPADAGSWLVLVRDCFIAARSTLAAEAQQTQADLREYGTTFNLAILTPDWLATGHIGDGATVALMEDNSLVVVSLPKNEEYVNVTFPLTMPEMEQHAEFKACALKVKALAMFSDGMQHVSIHSLDNTAHTPFFLPLFQQLPGIKEMDKASNNLGEFMASEAICARTHDDKTLVLIGRRSGG
jgi:hypothetical protein